MNLPEIKGYDDLTVGEAKELFDKGASVIALKTKGDVTAAIFPKKFLEFVCLKKLKSTDSALKTKTKDLAVVPDSLDVGQLSKCLERHDAVIVERRTDNKIQKLWAATAKDTFKLFK